MISSSVVFYAILVALFVIGACVGRVLNICVIRFPQVSFISVREQFSTLRKRPWTICLVSECAPKGVASWPIVGWLIGMRRCGTCKRRIQAPFFVIEVITATLFVWVYRCEIPFGPNASLLDSGLYSAEGPAGPEMIQGMMPTTLWLHLRYVLHMAMICGLIVATEIDRRIRSIPDGASVPIMYLAICWHFVFPQSYLVPIWFQDVSFMKSLQPVMPELLQPLFVSFDTSGFVNNWPFLHGLLVGTVGACVGAGIVAVVRVVGNMVLKVEAMGKGDVILMGMIGAVIGWQPVVTVFMLAPILAIAFSIINWIIWNDKWVPYGPFLSAAAVLLLMTWPVSWPYAKRFFDLGPMLIAMALAMVVLLAVSLQLVQFLKKLFGLRTDFDVLEEEVWSSADQIQYENSERPDDQTGQWPRDVWEGRRAGQGLGHSHRWRGR